MARPIRVAAVLMTLLLSACSGSSKHTTTTSTTTASSPTSTTVQSATTATTGPARTGQDLAYALQTASFKSTAVNAHLHVVGVGPSEAATAGQGRVDSALVNVASDVSAERVSAIYDVYDTPANAERAYRAADANAKAAGGYKSVTLSPSTSAYCGRQSDGSSNCWFAYRAAVAVVDVSGAGSSSTDDATAVMQAMLTHLVELAA